MQKLGGFIIVAFLIYFGIATYGAHHACKQSNGVLVVGLGWFECVQPVKARGQHE